MLKTKDPLKMNDTQNVIGEYSNESDWSNTEWLSKITKKTVIEAEIKDFKGTGQISDAKEIFLKTDSGEEMNLFLKVIAEGKKEFFKKHRVAREAFFFTKFGSLTAGCCIENFSIPKCYYAYGDFTTGDKIVILENINEYINTVFCMGVCSPFNTMSEYEEKSKDI